MLSARSDENKVSYVWKKLYVISFQNPNNLFRKKSEFVFNNRHEIRQLCNLPPD